MTTKAALVIGIVMLLHTTALKCQTHFVVGTEDINFYPHYNFTSSDSSGFANEVLQLFASKHGYQFSFQPLPVKRLYHELDGLVDFIYPDNPNWAKYQSVQASRSFSDPLIYNLGTTMVLAADKDISLSQFRTLAVIHGFTPTAWLNLRSQHRFKFYEVPNAISAVNLVLKGELQGADVEYNVAQHILRTQQQEGALVVASQLPMTRVSFHLSTMRHPLILQQFNRFLLNHQADIAALKHKYQLIDSLPQ
ncbi:MAG: transporter substrate-binding domain-containing protein [Gammaproteobacteria bacterium]|nr:transporter substrate-binding domain-containing protein [Gammaproteobacteria bacterium]MBU1556720.1 transporter substrate-binding domain-containing protein [Gammaproteobacteria bacterium]MBU2071625.1 transporter substrate-binding domain-containing protein [Gammaproteobacteria bacterium]MBU2182875.1 transporter substrate-binding domain-containing protein [Gammaproteobacteria bacterium]MBU2203479.1 transporter substrate-binding domain-containing protein [Gammaproteobacteria bacterium]